MEPLPPHDTRNAGMTRRDIALLAFILALATAVRLWNLGWGLPDLFEEATPFTVARKFWGPVGGSFAFHPDFFALRVRRQVSAHTA